MTQHIRGTDHIQRDTLKNDDTISIGFQIFQFKKGHSFNSKCPFS